MPAGDEKGRCNPPAPEAPVWLPSLAQPKLPSGFSLRKEHRQPTLDRNSDLFNPNTLSQGGLNATIKAGRKGTTVPKLPSISASQNRTQSASHGLLGSGGRDDTQRLTAQAQEQHAEPWQHNTGNSSDEGEAWTDAEEAQDDEEQEEMEQQQQQQQQVQLQHRSGPAARAGATAHAHEPEYDPDWVPGVHTGDDVVAFYGEHGQDSAVKFFYCNRSPLSMHFRPYDLLVVPRSKIQNEYFTLSATGVMRIRKGVQAEFTPLAEWVREKTLFDLISKIGFFRNYLTGRCFRCWHKGVRRRNFLRVKRCVEERLFLAKPTFCPYLREIYSHVSQLHNISFAGSQPNHLYSLQEYAELQYTTREQKAKPAMDALVDKIQKVLERACKEAHKQAQLYQESIRDHHELEDTTGVELFQGRTSGKARPMVTIKKEKIDRASNYARVMQELTQLGSFIRLADYLFVEGVIARAIASVEEMLGLLTQQKAQADKQSKGVFLTTIAFQPDCTSFTPNETAILDELNNNTIEGAIVVAQQAPRLLFMRQFAQFFEGKPSGLNTVNIIRSTPHFMELRQRINDTVIEDFAAAREYVKTFDDYRKIYDFGRTWDPDEPPTSVNAIRVQLRNQRQWKTELERMKISNVVGSLYVDSKSLRNDLMPITTSALDRMKLAMLGYMREACVELLDNLKERIAALQQRPTTLDDFVAYQMMHQQQVDERRMVVDHVREVDGYVETLGIFDQKIPTSDAVKLDDLHEAEQQLIAELTLGKEFIADQKEEQMGVLSHNMTDLNEELVGLLGQLHTGKYVDAEADAEAVVNDLEEVQAHVNSIRQAQETYNDYSYMFGIAAGDFSNLMLAEKEVNSRHQLWRSLLDFMYKSRCWTEDPILDDFGCVQLNIEEIRGDVEEYAQRAYKASKASKDDAVVHRLKENIDDFKEIMPLVEELANPALQPRHWDEIFKLIGADIGPNEQGTGYQPFSIQLLLQHDLLDNLERISAISANASKESSLEKALIKMRADWEGVEFLLAEYKDTGTYIVGGTDQVQALLDDQIVKTQSMRASPFIKPLESECLRWEALLSGCQELVDSWLACQAVWQYLEPIFSSPDILKQMPEEGEKFQQVDTMWRELMESAHLVPGCLTLAADQERLAALAENNRLLEEIQKGLAAYLEVKRIAFPRFFFLSNDEMLEILSETKDPTRVQPHLKKCFEGIDKLRFEGAAAEHITGICSVEGETIPLKTRIKPADANGAVEKWLGQVEQGMVESVKDSCEQGIRSYPARPRKEWVLEWPGQVVLVVTATFWTADITAAITSGQAGALAAEAEKCTAQLNDNVDLVRGELSTLNRATLSALVVMDVHARDVVAALAAERIEGEPTHFSWTSQLRMYWEDLGAGSEGGPTIVVRMMNAHVEYGYEYLGNGSRLVVTPLTDRCYRTLMGAIHLNLGGAPEGPAGTGKTETTKDLAKALARQCVVFNCSDTLDYLTMAKFFKGLASSGAWACFDEFNRIDLEVLSVVAQQVLEVQMAVKARVKTFIFEGSELPLRPTCNVFITMNPGYAGRSELPDNLKALFRTVAMMVPDYAMIAEIMLYSNGYLKARECARKIVATYKLCSEQLSSQDHYDYGMRAVMAVLRAAGNLKRRFPVEEEFVLMLRSIIDVNLCKFLSHDVPLFNGIVSDLFPGVHLPAPDYESLDGAVRAQCALLNVQPTEYFLMKVTQLYEMIVVRHGLMTVGQPFSGKSTALRVLAGALTDLGERKVAGALFNRVQMRVINPKSVTMGQLYGETDKGSQEWKDGVLAVTFRSLASDPSVDRKWLVLDGPVDAIWIENMNTVLDDNRKLCLPNSEIIQMSPTMSMIFEVGDLAAASPATVSRCGMVYLEPHQLGWRPLLTSWLQTLPDAVGPRLRQQLESLYDWAMPLCLRFVRRELKELSTTEDSNLARTSMRLLLSLMDELQPVAAEDSTAAAGSIAGGILSDGAKLRLVESLFMFSMVWSVGCTADGAGRKKFDAFFRQVMAGVAPNGYGDYVTAKPPSVTAPMMPDDLGATVHDFTYNKQSSSWQLWTETLSHVDIPAGAEFGDIIVPTKDSARYTFLLNTALHHGQPLLMVGPTGTGKSIYINRHLLRGLPADKWTPLFVTLSARTSANMTQEQVDGRLDKRKKGVYGPPVGKKTVVFVDDLNMPSKEVYGAQPPIELLRQAMDHDGWYGRDNGFRQMVDVQFIAAMGPPGGGRTAITNRYLRHFNTLALAQVSDEDLSHIFRTILEWHLGSQPFPASVKQACEPLIAATLEVYARSAAKLLPTPTKSHYVFNLRDMARVVQGIMMLPAAGLARQDAAAAGRVYKRLWVHEVFRVFYDRLVDDTDREWLMAQVKEISQQKFGDDFDQLMSHLKAADAAAPAVTHEDMRKCFFGDYMNTAAEPADRQYAEVTDTTRLLSTIEEYLTDHNASSKRPMNLAMFLFAVEHVSRICRLLKQPGGHMLLVGVGGSGRQSLARLAAFICGMEVHQVEISKSYNKADWREDLKRILRRAGAEAKRCMFLFSDTQIKDESFIEDINNLLNSGEVPNMFPSDEKMAVLEAVRPAAAKRGLETPLELWGYFVEQCKRHLHVVLCMSPIGEAFRERLRQNPSLVNCCTIDWFQPWPGDALEAVALKFLKEMDLDGVTRKKLVSVCQQIHNKVQDASQEFLSELGRHNYVTPTSYLELISSFRTLLEAKKAENIKLRRRYQVGLEKLQSSAEQIAGMQTELQALQPQLVQTVAEVEALMGRIAHDKKHEVEPKAAIVKEEEAKAQEKANAAKAIKDECEADLAKALPIMRDALAALDTINEQDINYIRKLANPPSAIKLVMEAVCVVLDVKPAKAKDDAGKPVLDYWKPSLVLLNEKDFLAKLKTYDKDSIPPRVVAAIRSTYLTDESFTPENAKRASPAAEGMCKWVRAMSEYDKVAKVVGPKKAKLGEAETAYEEVMVGLRAKQSELQGLLDKLAAMEADLKANTRKKEELEAEIELCKVKLERAEKLIGGLGGEKTRWSEAADVLAKAQVNLTGDMLVAAAVIAYLGAFTPAYRAAIQASCVELCDRQKLMHSAKYSLATVLGEPVKVRDWLIAGLPNDAFSVENGIIVANARRWPLMIDPQGQANKWVKNLEKANSLQVIKLSEGGEYLRVLENAIQFGQPVLLENIGEELDPSLEPLLLKQIFKSGGVNCIRLGDSTVEYSDQFRFYMTTKLRNPHYLPEIAVKVSLLNFMITPAGLSDQLLGCVVATERPDLEEQKAALVLQGAENNRKLKEIEDKILEVLSNSEGNILEDETAIGIITEAKVLGNDIAQKQLTAAATEKEIDDARTGYKPCGDYTSILFFCISDLAAIDPMYQYSLPWFINLFVSSVRAADKAEVLEERLQNIHDHFTYALYRNVCRSLFEKDKLLFACLLCIKILQSRGDVDSDEWMFLLTGGLGIVRDVPNPASSWLMDRSWKALAQLSKLPAFMGLQDNFQMDPEEWREMYDSLEPHKASLPGFYNTLDRFKRLLLVRCLRPDKVVPAVQDFVEASLGRRYVEPPPFDLHACYADSAPTTPLIFALSPGSDPTAALLQFAAERNMSSRLSAISLGQGQGPKAAALIAEGAAAGSWVVLQNCHLAPSWMPALDRICEELNPETTHADFRLWMTSYPSAKFPVNILQNSVKMTNEPPKGIRANMRRSFNMEPLASDTFFQECKQPRAFKKLAFGLVYFHALVQERRKFGPLGWNIPYGFDDGDQRISLHQLRMFLDENDRVPFDALRYVTGECNYGGRVTDDKDRLLLNCILEKSYTSAIVDSDSYQLSSSGLYHAPAEGDREAHLAYIDSLPIVPLPEAFGLHENADITKDLNDTELMCNSLLNMNSSGGGGGGGGAAGPGGSEARVASLVRECLQQLPANFDIEAVQRKYPVCYEESMHTVLAQEMSRFNRLATVIRDSLRSMDLALQGLSVMSAELEAAYRSVAINQVPDVWKRVSYPSLKPLGSYLEDLYQRLSMLQRWYEHGPPPAHWLSGFFFVQSFLTAGLQNYARKHGIPVDVVGYDFEMLEVNPARYSQPPAEGVYVHGLYLEGCGWDAPGKKLAESQPKVLFVPAPCMWLRPKRTDAFAQYQHYNCPVYRTAERRGVLATTGHSTNFVMFIKLPTDRESQHWTLRGVALLSQLSD